MSEPNALFGADGTQLPDPLPVLSDPLTGLESPSWRHPVPVSPALGQRAVQEVTPLHRPAPQAPVRPPVRAHPPVSVPARTLNYVDPRGRFELDLPRRTPRVRSRSGTRTGCVLALIIFGVVVFNIVAGIVHSMSGLFH